MKEELKEKTMALSREMLKNILEGNAAAAAEKYEDIMALKIASLFEERKKELAESLYVRSDSEELEEDVEQLDEISKELAASTLAKRKAEGGVRSPIERYNRFRASVRADGYAKGNDGKTLRIKPSAVRPKPQPTENE